ncbi:EEF1A lysine methyltransferase 1 [Vitis vinifera]|uniref:EEF1A lysine methyltransferase 1 n=1 Tax=Vitis vinifera TaxID=29760 RepID=A0A438DSF9_VITVI|nr:EEF1A lysine methyltransferase 1 [Vitis vinifera]
MTSFASRSPYQVEASGQHNQFQPNQVWVEDLQQDYLVLGFMISKELQLGPPVYEEFSHFYWIMTTRTIAMGGDPFCLSKECLEKVAQTISFLARPGESFLLLLTGEVQRERAAELLGMHPCCFRPQHSNKLGNEFRLFTNYDPGTRLGGWDKQL